MKNAITFLLFILITQCTLSQSPLPNANIPLPLMVPVKPRKPVAIIAIQKNDCAKYSKMVAFTLPCCIQLDTVKSIKEIATIIFDNAGCKTPDVVFYPTTLIPSQDFETVTIKASVGEEFLISTINVIRPSINPVKKSAPFTFEEEAEQYKTMMERLKNNSEPAAETSGNTFPTGDMKYVSNYTCCDSSITCFVENKKYEGSYTWDFEITAHVPLYGIPFTKTMDGIIIGLATLKATMNEETNCKKTEPCPTINGEVSIGGKVSRILPENIIESDIRLQTKIDYHPTKCETEEMVNNKQKFSCEEMKVKGTVTSGWGLVTHTFDYIMYSKEKK